MLVVAGEVLGFRLRRHPQGFYRGRGRVRGVFAGIARGGVGEVALHQVVQATVKDLANRQQFIHLGIGVIRLPLGDGLAGNSQQDSQAFLGQAVRGAQIHQVVLETHFKLLSSLIMTHPRYPRVAPIMRMSLVAFHHLLVASGKATKFLAQPVVASALQRGKVQVTARSSGSGTSWTFTPHTEPVIISRPVANTTEVLAPARIHRRKRNSRPAREPRPGNVPGEPRPGNATDPTTARS